MNIKNIQWEHLHACPNGNKNAWDCPLLFLFSFLCVRWGWRVSLRRGSSSPPTWSWGPRRPNWPSALLSSTFRQHFYRTDSLSVSVRIVPLHLFVLFITFLVLGSKKANLAPVRGNTSSIVQTFSHFMYEWSLHTCHPIVDSFGSRNQEGRTGKICVKLYNTGNNERVGSTWR